MRPSRLFLWLALIALLLALVIIVFPVFEPIWALVSFAMLLAALFVDWIASVGPRGIDLEFTGDREAFSGETVRFELKMAPRHKGGRLPQNPVFGNLELGDGLISNADVEFVEGIAKTDISASRRGRWVVHRLWLFWKSRFGLIDFVPVRAIDHTVNVVPNIRAVTSGQIDLEMRSSEFGAKQTNWRGEGSEFHQLTDYVAGMDPRSIDWKQSARHHALISKEMRAERNHQIIIALDNGHLMREEVAGLPKIDHKINAALALTWAGVQGGDQVGLFAFDARPRLFVPPQPGRMAFAQLRSKMADLEYKSVETNHTLALSYLHQKLSKRGLVVVFTDFVDPLTAQLLVDHIAILSKHHVVIYVSLNDPLLEGLVGEKTQTMTDIARSVSAAEYLAERRSVLDQMASMGVNIIEADPGSVTPRLINTYMSIKAREMI